MWPFTESQAVRAETIPQLTDEQRLAEIETQYRLADREFITACLAVAHYASLHKDARTFMLNDKLYARVGAMSRDPFLQRLEAAREQARERRSSRLRERADLLMQLKIYGGSHES